MKNNVTLYLIKFSSYVVIIAILAIILTIILMGYKEINYTFLFTAPLDGMTKGGIYPAILGTFVVTFIMIIFSAPLGIGAAIYLSEYAKDRFITRFIRLTVRNLSGVPSIIYGLFGVAIFCNMLNIGRSILASSMTLALLTLPYIITTAEESLKRVPDIYRMGALALGADKWTMVSTIVLPSAMPGILTGIILGLSRAAGETAPILFTGVAFSTGALPTSIYDKFMALPYHLYILATQHHNMKAVSGKAWATALVLIGIVLILNMAAFYVRNRYEFDQD